MGFFVLLRVVTEVYRHDERELFSMFLSDAIILLLLSVSFLSEPLRNTQHCQFTDRYKRAKSLSYCEARTTDERDSSFLLGSVLRGACAG